MYPATTGSQQGATHINPNLNASIASFAYVCHEQLFLEPSLLLNFRCPVLELRRCGWYRWWWDVHNVVASRDSARQCGVPIPVVCVVACHTHTLGREYATITEPRNGLNKQSRPMYYMVGYPYTPCTAVGQANHVATRLSKRKETRRDETRQ